MMGTFNLFSLILKPCRRDRVLTFFFSYSNVIHYPAALFLPLFRDFGGNDGESGHFLTAHFLLACGPVFRKAPPRTSSSRCRRASALRKPERVLGKTMRQHHYSRGGRVCFHPSGLCIRAWVSTPSVENALLFCLWPPKRRNVMQAGGITILLEGTGDGQEGFIQIFIVTPKERQLQMRENQRGGSGWGGVSNYFGGGLAHFSPKAPFSPKNRGGEHIFAIGRHG